MKRKLTSLLALLMAAAIMLVGCFGNDPDNGGGVNLNETTPLVLQTGTLDGVFNPFFHSSAYDRDVTDLVNASLFTVSPAGEVVAGDQYATIAKSYDIKLNEDGTATYEIVLKNNLKFSDGTAITVDDVLFNYYVYLDPKYDGSSTMYTLPIQGLTEYRTQVTPDIVETYGGYADAIFALGEDYEGSFTGGLTEALYNAYWANLDEGGTMFAQSIISFVASSYGSDTYVKAYFHPGMTWNDIKDDPGLVNAYGMALWGFGGFDAPFSADANGDWVNLVAVYEAYDEDNADHEGKPFFNLEEAETGAYVLVDGAVVDFDADEHEELTRYKVVAVGYDDWGAPLVGDYVRTQAAGYAEYKADKHAGLPRYSRSIVFTSSETETSWTMEGNDFPTAADYWTEIRAAYGSNYSEADGINYEKATSNIEEFLKELFILAEGSKEVEGGVPNISGITKGTKNVGGTTYQTITIQTTKQDPKTILSLGVVIAPKAYYTAGYTYKTGDDVLVNYGAELNSAEFMAHLKTKNSKPVGAGPYKFERYEDNVVYFERSSHFSSFNLGGNAKIKYLRMKVISLGQEYDALKTDEVHYATVSSTASVVSEAATIAKLTPLLVDNLGYGYIAINPNVYTNLNERIALQTTINLDLVYEYYQQGLAEVIYRSMTNISWAYPADAENLYEFDATAATAMLYFEKAGYTRNGEGHLIKPGGSRAHFVFTLPSGAADHPAGQLYIEARKTLEKIGATVEIKVDTNLIANIRNGNVGIYALAWSAALDPDMFQVYHIDSQATNVKSNGIKGLYANPDAATADFGTIEWKGETLTQKQALEKLAQLIEDGRKYMLPADRAPIYADALNLLAELVIELPTYQRKNLFILNNSVIDETTISDEITPYWGPLAEIWKVEIKKAA